MREQTRLARSGDVGCEIVDEQNALRPYVELRQAETVATRIWLRCLKLGRGVDSRAEQRSQVRQQRVDVVGDQRGVVGQDGYVDGFTQAAGNLEHRAIDLHGTARRSDPIVQCERM